MTTIREGFKETEIGLVPKNWDIVTLPDVCKILDSRRKPIKAADRESMRGEVPYYGASGIIDYVNDYLFDEDIILLGEDGENLRSRNSPLAFKVTGKCWVNNHAHVMAIENPKRDSVDYMTYFLESQDYTPIVIGSAQPKITQQDLRRIKIARPNYDEQKQIAEILSATDEHIEKLDKTIADYELLKKGMLKKLLTEGIGHTEFKETEIGRIPKAWGTLRLVDASKNKGQYGIGSKAIDYVAGRPRYLRITDIDDYGNLADLEHKTIAEEDYEEYILHKNDLVFARTGNTTGKTYLYNEADGVLVYAGFLIKFTLDSSIVIPEYVKQFCQTKQYWDWVKKSSTRSGQPGINSAQYGELRIPTPSLEEQQYIARLLHSIDERMSLFKEERKDIFLLKCSLMGKLLTGKIRVQ